MGKELTEADMSDYVVHFGVNHMPKRKVRAAYATPHDTSAITAQPSIGFIYFKDWQHKVVAMVQAATVMLIERTDAPASLNRPGWPDDVDKIMLAASAGMTPNAIREFQDDLNAAAEKHGYRQRFLLVPAASRSSPSVPLLPVPAGDGR
jgi:hypothetical protein